MGVFAFIVTRAVVCRGVTASSRAGAVMFADATRVISRKSSYKFIGAVQVEDDGFWAGLVKRTHIHTYTYGRTNTHRHF